MRLLHKLSITAMALTATGTLLYAAPGDNSGNSGNNDDAALLTGDGKHAIKSKQEMAEILGDLYRSMPKKLDHVTRLREAAAKAKEVVKQNCLADTLIRMKGLYNSFDRAASNVERAMNSGDDATRATQFDNARDRGKEFGETYDEALRCVGDDRTFTGELDVQVDSPEGIDDPNANPWDPGIEPPVYKTPF